jgi:hypothetical protein
MPMERLNKLKKGHYRNKQVGIEQCKRILKQNEEDQKWIDFFENCGKRDDLADSICLALSYLSMYKLGKFSIP